MRWFILANGKATRWDNYLGVDKQLINIGGEPLLNRTVRLLNERNQTDVVIVGPYDIEGSSSYIPDFESVIGKFDVTKKLWGDINEFVLLYGDCFYTEAIIEDIISKKPDKWLHWTCQRPNPNTGKPWEEGYAHKISDIPWWSQKCEEFHKMLDEGQITQPYKDWMFCRYICEIDLYCHQPELMKQYEVEWCDMTDDFDFPIDYDRWMSRNGETNDE